MGDPLFLAAEIDRVAYRADVPYEIARDCIMAGMDEWTAVRWLNWGKRTGRSPAEVIALWRERRRDRGRRWA